MLFRTKAIRSIKNKDNIQEALDWLDKHSDNPPSSHSDNDKEESVEDAKSTTSDKKEEESNKKEDDEEHSSNPTVLKCNACEKLFKSVEFAQLHATRSGHDDFSESTEQKPELTPEEKTKKLGELRALLTEKRKLKEKEESEETLKQELFRRKVGKETIQQKRDIQEKERIRYLEQQKRDQETDKELLEKIKKQIQEDREQMKEKIEREKQSFNSNPDDLTISKTDSNFLSNSSIKNDSEACSSTFSQSIMHSDIVKIHIRTPDGKSTFLELKSSTKLKDLYSKVKENSSYTKLYIPFPRTFLNNENDAEKTLDELGLCPSVALIFQ